MPGNEFYLGYRLANLKERTALAGQMREEVLDIEETLSPINQFPQQNVAGILSKLNTLIPKDSWLTNIEVDGGQVELRGYSPSAASIIEILSQQPEYEAVGLTGNTQNDNKGERFSIGFRIAGIDVEAYLAEYFLSEE